MFLLRLSFEKEGQLRANFLFYILIIYCNFFGFQCLSRGIPMFFPTKQGFKMNASITKKSAICLWKMLILNLNFQGEYHCFAKFLFYILIISRKCHTFQFLTCGIHIYFPILTRVENGRFAS